MYHFNQEDKTGKAPYATYTKRNFSDDEPMFGKEAYMKIVREKPTLVESSYIFLRGMIRNLISRMDTK